MRGALRAPGLRGSDRVRIGVAGLGLIGASVALGLRAKHEIRGYDVSNDVRGAARRRGITAVDTRAVRDSAQAAGAKEVWMVEGGTPNTLLRSGINRNSLKPGTEIIVRGYQSKDKLCKPACKANGRDVTFPDGRKLFMGSSGTGAPKDGADASER